MFISEFDTQIIRRRVICIIWTKLILTANVRILHKTLAYQYLKGKFQPPKKMGLRTYKLHPPHTREIAKWGGGGGWRGGNVNSEPK